MGGRWFGPDRTKLRFDGEIAGLGTTSGARVVVGHWPISPYADFCDVMVQQADGWRVLLAPTSAVAAFVSHTYVFDEVVVGAVDWVENDTHRTVTAPDLTLDLEVGGRTPLGVLLSALPRRLATSPRWARAVSPVARLVLPGVRTFGSAGGGRTESYGAWDVRRIVAVHGRWRGADLGTLARMDPPVTVGFGSAPRAPSLTSLVTTVHDRG